MKHVAKTVQETDLFFNKMLIGSTATFLAGADFLGVNAEGELGGQCPDELEKELAACIEDVGRVEMEYEDYLVGAMTLGAGFIATSTAGYKRRAKEQTDSLD